MNLVRTIKVTLPINGFSVLENEMIDCIRFVSITGGGMGGGTQVNFGTIIEEEHDRIKINNIIKNVEMYVYRNAMVTQQPTKLLKVIYSARNGYQLRYFQQDSDVKLQLSNEVSASHNGVDSELDKVRVFLMNYDIAEKNL
ncbi:hypothetical protein OTK49_21350 [Vibrio coralliirubri]|uniref:hypothetical protein n=1 Tax=Vibrio coralliirubri TaxID=1516159 RepID=UPI0022849F9A|nr:hypothetical protein [Vibrio coralliirubri]MCY9865068.1 hypothetical protein [Vibrio coralliirubri]